MFSAYIAALGKGKRKLPPPVTSFTEIVSKKIVSVSSKIIFILRRALRGGDMNFKSLIEASESRSDMVATFLAVLELVKAKRMTAEGNGDEMKLVLKNQKD